MTAQTTDVYSGNVRPTDADEIDLRRYVVAALRWWREIVTISLLMGLLTGGALIVLNSLKGTEYSASADILIERLLSTIELDERVNTMTGVDQNDPNIWRSSLLQLSKSSVVAQAVLDELRDDLPPSLHEAERLMTVVQVEIPRSPDDRFASNLIRITAITDDPAQSALIANAWAHHLVDFINGLYGEVPETTIESVTADRDEALAAYQVAEKEYEQFVGSNHMDSLTRQIEQKATLRSEIMANYTRMLTSVVSSEYNTRVRIYTTLATTPINHAMSVIQAQSNGTMRTFNSLYDERATVMAQLNQARTMQESLRAGGEAAAKSNVTALQMLKVSTLSIVPRANAAQLSPMALPTLSMTQEEQLADVEALVQVLETYVTQLDGEITALAESGIVGADFESIAGLAEMIDPDAESAQSATNQKVTEAYTELMGPDGLLSQPPIDIDSTLSDAHEQVLATLENEIRALRAEISAEEAMQRELVYRRDLAWKTYDTVGNKLEELNLLRSSANSEVRIGNPALVPVAPVPVASPLLPVIGMTLIGFFIAVVLALLAEMIGVNPIFSRRTA